MSKSDWERVKREGAEGAPIPFEAWDGPYDPNDERATKSFLREATVRRPGQRGRQKAATKQLVSLRLSQEVLEYFKATGPGWQTRIDEVLKRAAGK
jgi:uncharacterized protein (DUF4415 family)